MNDKKIIEEAVTAISYKGSVTSHQTYGKPSVNKVCIDLSTIEETIAKALKAQRLEIAEKNRALKLMIARMEDSLYEESEVCSKGIHFSKKTAALIQQASELANELEK